MVQRIQVNDGRKGRGRERSVRGLRKLILSTPLDRPPWACGLLAGSVDQVWLSGEEYAGSAFDQYERRTSKVNISKDRET